MQNYFDSKSYLKDSFSRIQFLLKSKIRFHDSSFRVRSRSERTSNDKINSWTESLILKSYKIIEVNNFYNNLKASKLWIRWGKWNLESEKKIERHKNFRTEFIKNLRNYKILWNRFYRLSQSFVFIKSAWSEILNRRKRLNTMNNFNERSENI